MPLKGPHIKALFLLIMFSLNTVVSFACSLGGFFHSFHHHAASSTQKRQHGHHQHKEGHQHHHGTTLHHHDNTTSEKPDDDCCSKNVVKMDKVEKALGRTIQAPDVVFLTSFLSAYSSLFTLFPAAEKTFYPDAVRWRLPATIQDLRIVIQSFQI